jgi:hypothetical protein
MGAHDKSWQQPLGRHGVLIAEIEASARLELERNIWLLVFRNGGIRSNILAVSQGKAEPKFLHEALKEIDCLDGVAFQFKAPSP